MNVVPHSFKSRISATAPAALEFGQVVGLLPDSRCMVQCAGGLVEAPLSAHLNHVTLGQQVLLADGGDMTPLVIAAYPLVAAATPLELQEPSTSIAMDQATGTLIIKASQLQLQGVAAIELRCGDAVLRLNAQGEASLNAQAITQAAIGPMRIEGASIDLN